LAEARASRAAASQALARAEALYESRSLTKPELEQARAGLDAIDARIAAAEAQVREANLTRADADLRAPFAGVILKRHVDVGSLASPGAPAFSLADLGTVKVVIGVPDTMLRRFHDGAVEPIVSEATPNRRFEGRVTKVAPAADPRSRLFDVELAVSNLDGALRPGMVATVDVGEAGASPASEVVTVPLSAVVRAPEGGDRYAVFLVETAAGGATARLRAIRLGDMVGNEIAVVEGLAEGDRVIVRGATVVTDGERVNPAP
jgi:multidrug efflux system membrane fusion protein